MDNIKPHPPPGGNYYLVPTDMFEQFKDMKLKLDRTYEIVKQLSSVEPLQGYISEDDAKIRFKRGTTWFWTRRQEGLPFIKVGSTNYYQISNLLQFFSDDSNESKT